MRTNVTGVAEAIRALRRLGPRGEEIASREVVASALTVQREAKRATPVDSGRLRNSITVAETQRQVAADSARATGEDAGNREPAPAIRAGMLNAVVGTNVEYSRVVHFGGLGRRAKPFLLPPLERERPQLRSRLQRALRELERG